MALSQPKPLYGIHSVSPYSRTDGTFYGILKVLKGSTLSLAASQVALSGGSSRYDWASETGAIKAEVSLKVDEFPDFVYTLFLGATPTTTGSSTTGSVSTLTNKYGTSLKNATTGIASVGITSSTGAALLKFGKYVVKYASATTVDVYFSSDADIGRGTAGTYQNDLLKITASPLTITTGGVATVVPNFGIELIGGSGTIAFVAGATATFSVLPPSNSSTVVSVGSINDTFPEFGMIIMAERTGNKQMHELDIFRCKGGGMPLGFSPHAYASADIKIDVLYDSTLDKVFDSRWVEET